jgi:hypothetical protein
MAYGVMIVVGVMVAAVVATGGLALVAPPFQAWRRTRWEQEALATRAAGGNREEDSPTQVVHELLPLHDRRDAAIERLKHVEALRLVGDQILAAYWEGAPSIVDRDEYIDAARHMVETLEELAAMAEQANRELAPVE